MRVLKIIQANSTIFNTDPNKNYTEIDAIRIVASMESKGNTVQKLQFEIRQTHTAIYNLIGIGYVEDAMALAINLVPKAEMAKQFRIANDLCNTLINYFNLEGDVESVHLYQSLYEKFSSIVHAEHQSMMWFGKALYNQKQLGPYGLNEVQPLLDLIEKKLPEEIVWYHYYYYQFKLIILLGQDLEKLYFEAIEYFKNLHVKHSYFIHIFTEGLIMFYLENNAYEKAEEYLKLLDPGSKFWFRTYLSYATALLKQGDIKSNDICILTMNHPLFIDLSLKLKKEWRIIYKASVRLLLKY